MDNEEIPQDAGDGGDSSKPKEESKPGEWNDCNLWIQRRMDMVVQQYCTTHIYIQLSHFINHILCMSIRILFHLFLFVVLYCTIYKYNNLLFHTYAKHSHHEGADNKIWCNR